MGELAMGQGNEGSKGHGEPDLDELLNGSSPAQVAAEVAVDAKKQDL